MKFQGLIFCSALMFLAACSSTPKVAETSAEPVLPTELPAKIESPKPASATNYYLICKAKKRAFQFDWNTGKNGGEAAFLDQNSVRYDFRAANRPAGNHGENLKVGECGWSDRPLAKDTSKKEKKQLVYKSLTDEATQKFYKMRTGKVFMLPVRHTKNGVEALPGASVKVIR